jgi:hypothetical protein
MFDNNFDTVQAPDPNIIQVDTMESLFKTNIIILLEMNTHIYFLTWDWTYTQTTEHLTLKHASNR